MSSINETESSISEQSSIAKIAADSNKLPIDILDTSTSLLKNTRCLDRYQELEELLEFAAENGKLDPPELAIKVKKFKKVLFYTPPDALTPEMICETEAELEKLYATFTELLSPVTALTLRTTSEKYAVHRSSLWKAIFLGSSSVGRNFFRQLFWVAMLLIGLICLRKLTMGGEEDSLAFVDPFLYGALGALVYLYKNLTDFYTRRILHPRKLATNWLRLFMGALTGALVVNLFGASLENAIPGTNISPVALGFLAGYSVEFFYQALDKFINTITPKDKTQATSTVATTPRQTQMAILTKRLKEMTNEEDKAAIRRLLEKI
jgi:hypothetical protein